MKPIELEMTAFGPYREKTPVIRFSEFGDGIFVITGETGAGKTTIFDAIMFALFGEVSAKPVDSKKNNIENGSARTVTMLHSDFAPKTEDSKVRFVFEENGRRYTINRTIHIVQKRDKTFGETKLDAELEGEGMTAAVKGTTPVTDYVVNNILKMNAVQFRQIVMLAQGEFKAFIQAKDEDRKTILGALFDSTPYRMFEQYLSDAKAELQKRWNECTEEEKRALKSSSFVLPAEMTDAERATFAAEYPELVNSLTSLVKRDEEKEQILSEQKKNNSKKQTELTEEKTRAEGNNAKLADLESRKNHLAALNSLEKKAEIETIQKNREQTAKALHIVKPVESQARRDSDEYETKKTHRKNAENELAGAVEQKKIADEEYAKNSKRTEQVDILNAQIRRIEEHLDDIEALQNASEKKVIAEKAKKAAEHAADYALIKEQKLQKRLKEISEELVLLADVDEKANSASEVFTEARTQYNELVKRDDTGIIARIRAAKDDEQKVRVGFDNLEKLSRKAARASKKLEETQTRYFSGYAGKLAEELRSELQKSGEAKCPVCGCVHHPGEEIHFAEIQAETPTEEEYQSAQTESNEANEEWKAAGAGLNEAKRHFESEKKLLVAEVKKQIPKIDWTWDSLSDGRTFPDVLIKFDDDVQEKKRKRDAAVADQNKKKKLVEEQQNKNAELSDVKTEILNQRAEAKRQEIESEHCSAEAKRLLAELEKAGISGYSTKAQAENKKKELEVFRSNLQLKNEEAERIDREATKRESSARGSLETQKNAEEAAEEQMRKSHAEYLDSLTSAGFAEEKAYHTAAERPGRIDGEAWLKAQDAKVNDYRNDVKNTGERIEELRAETEGLVFVDIRVIEKEIAGLKEQEKKLNASIRELDIRRNGHGQALQIVTEQRNKRAKIQPALERIAKLSLVASGSSGSGGKRTFEGYVMGRTFDEVLDHASRYLSEMTGGQYILKHDQEAAGARKNASADFRIMIEDTLTGQSREVGSISGGESFQVSMALALGLSDTVQSHASTVKIDTMFIDEGFGSLDNGSLHQMLHVLKGLNGGKRQIGIISHVDALEDPEYITKFIRVTKSRDKNGSSLKMQY